MLLVNPSQGKLRDGFDAGVALLRNLFKTLRRLLCIAQSFLTDSYVIQRDFAGCRRTVAVVCLLGFSQRLFVAFLFRLNVDGVVVRIDRL